MACLMQKVKARKCKSCKKEFTPKYNQRLAYLCCWQCALIVAGEKAEKKAKKKKKEFKAETRRMKENIKTLTEHLNDAQKEFNKWIRLRDKEEPCISCGTTNPLIQYAAGHYRTIAAAPQLRFTRDNVHKQCNKNCNKHLSGNITEYRINLVKKIGSTRVEILENNNQLAGWTIEKAKEIKIEYRAKWKYLETKQAELV